MTEIDLRVPVCGAGDHAVTAWLIEGDLPPPPQARVVERFGAAVHPAGCGCCQPRGGAAEALRRLYLRAARGDVPPLDRVGVLATPAGGDAVVQALRQDVFAAARYRRDE